LDETKSIPGKHSPCRRSFLKAGMPGPAATTVIPLISPARPTPASDARSPAASSPGPSPWLSASLAPAPSASASPPGEGKPDFQRARARDDFFPLRGESDFRFDRIGPSNPRNRGGWPRNEVGGPTFCRLWVWLCLSSPFGDRKVRGFTGGSVIPEYAEVDGVNRERFCGPRTDRVPVPFNVRTRI
jgi:hypothetical protein